MGKLREAGFMESGGFSKRNRPSPGRPVYFLDGAEEGTQKISKKLMISRGADSEVAGILHRFAPQAHPISRLCKMTLKSPRKTRLKSIK